MAITYSKKDKASLTLSATDFVTATKEGKLVIFSAPSGTGKTTIVKRLLQDISNLSFSISCTTRAPRGEEKDGKDYYFLSVAKFEAKIKAEEFVEYEEVYKERYYGTLQSELTRLWGEGKDIVFDIDVQGGITLKNKFGKQALSIFIAPPSVKELEKRLKGRGTDAEEVIKERVAKAQEELSFSDRFDKVVINDDLERAIEEIKKELKHFLKK